MRAAAGRRKIGSCGSIPAMLIEASVYTRCSRWTRCSGASRRSRGNDSMALIARIRRAACIHGLSPSELSLAMGLVGLDVVARLAPHAPNVTPIAASALFAGMVLRSRALALAVPLSAMLVSDLLVGAYDWRIMGVVYAALALPALLGRCGRAASPVLPPPLVLSSSLLFFATTNFAVWAFSGMYAHDLHGLTHCYVAALPFLYNTVIGDMVWATLLLGSWWSAKFLFAPAPAGGTSSPALRPGVGVQSRETPFRAGGHRGHLSRDATTNRARPS